ncbi:hypothetical protein, unlikely [Trypanosoma brucei gambiense DAL972]|uniref:Uncharacterized protein n=1 Tax=Trypanosoma brucei gambiense (strain MHOM/CI/86/DAL972) TaxID=679716 RepID=D0A3V4_TRYB9|nr:hypothetical protein, unlikely [Trypanosoma brucei gambiense DAL972]CBH15948.1 hypothetical protein, unlikely [Trypanosoma brucei gambiense DAL972]|eukprot:XP_011778212.1 hypothetical protein, unlikely [Trypanosoma brucei gambiense DAL972]
MTNGAEINDVPDGRKEKKTSTNSLPSDRTNPKHKSRHHCASCTLQPIAALNHKELYEYEHHIPHLDVPICGGNTRTCQRKAHVRPQKKKDKKEVHKFRDSHRGRITVEVKQITLQTKRIAK